MTQNPKVTIITVCYNAAKILEKTIESVISQDYPNLEYIIVDGASQDETYDIIKKYESKITRYISEPDNGLYDAMNKGLFMASGEYVNFMNAGDYFITHDVISKLIKSADLSADIIYGDAITVFSDGSEKYQSGSDDIGKLSISPIYRHNASFTRTSLHKQYPFDLTKSHKFEYALDYYHIYSIWSAKARFQHIQQPILKYIYDGVSSKPVRNVILNFRITHENKKIKIIDCILLIKRIFGAWNRNR